MKLIERLVFVRSERKLREYSWQGAVMVNTHFDDGHFKKMGAELVEKDLGGVVVERELRKELVVGLGLIVVGVMALRKWRE